MNYKRLFKTGQISIPKNIQNHLGIQEGDYLFIYHNQDNIIMVTDHYNQTLNQCIFRNGRISIPAELRKIVGITCETPLELLTTDKQNEIIIKVAK